MKIYRAGDIKTLLDKVADATGEKAVHSRLQSVYDKITQKLQKNLPFTETYLSNTLYYKVHNTDGNKEIRLSDENIEALVSFLGYDNFDQFIRSQSETIHPLLEHCKGEWYSYVRCNSGEPYLLRAPVTIFARHNSMYMNLKGKVRNFEGRVNFEGNCIYCHLLSGEDKNIHLVFRSSLSPNPWVLQGVFSGISSAGDPICGREILIKTNKTYEEMTNERIAIKEFKKGGRDEMIIAKYFFLKDENIMKAGKSSTFGIGDLIRST